MRHLCRSRRLASSTIVCAAALLAPLANAGVWGVANGGWYWGGWGWGGTAAGDYWRGAAIYAQGLGEYNHQTAIANSINMDTWIRWNEYWDQVQRESNRVYAARQAARRNFQISANIRRYLQLRDAPSTRDIHNGDAINLKIGLLSAPSALASVIQEYKNPIAPNAVVFSAASEGRWLAIEDLAELSAETSPAFASAKNLFQSQWETVRETAESALARMQAGDETINDVSRAKDALRVINTIAQIDSAIAGEEAAEVFQQVKRATAILDGIQSQRLVSAFCTLLAKNDKANVGDLIATINTYKLQLHPASSPSQRQTYTGLFYTLRAAREILSEETFAKVFAHTVARSPVKPTAEELSGK